MATLIPRTSGPQVQAQLGPQVRNTAQVDLSPSIRAAGLVGQAATDLFQQQKNRADLTAVMEARRELSDWEGATFNPANADGIAKYQGKNALQAHDALLGDLDQRVSTIRGRLSPEQQQRFDQVSFSFRDSVQGRLNNYADREYSAYEATERKATIDNIGQDAVSAGMSGDFGLADVRLQEAVGIASAAYQTQGMGAEAIKASERGIVSSVRKQTIIGMAQRDPYAAQDLYDRYADQLSPEDRAVVERDLRPYVQEQQAESDVEWARTGNPAAAIRSDAAGVQTEYASLGAKHGFRTTSTTRSEDENRRVGGVSNSQHLESRGTARDWSVKGKTPEQISAFVADLKAAGFQVITEPHGTGPHIHAELPSRRVAADVGGGGGEGKDVALARLDTIADPRRRRAARARYAEVLAVEKAQKEEAKKEAAMSIYERVAAAPPGTPLSKILGKAELQLVGLDSGLSESLNRFRKLQAEGQVIQDDPVTLETIQRMQALQPNEFAKLPLGQYADKLSGKTLKSLAEDQTKVSDPAKRADWMTDNERLERGFQMLGFGKDTDITGSGSQAKNAPRDSLRGEFRIAYQNAQTAFVQSTGKKPTPEQADVLLSATAKQFAQNLQAGRLGAVQEEGGKFKNNPRVKTGLYSSAAQFDLQVSQADRDAIRGAYADKYGRPPTDAWVTQYLARKSQGAKK
ncbi:TPA: D-Ala-D-Ala carboxypeptidase family metallohydrolase [Stenotrophomonas maltophilia]